jgi:ArsR family metal-binding transcriptional regulator
MAIARQRYPEVYADFQGRSSYSKSAPPTFESMVEQEMRKSGVTAEVAGQRILQAYGSAALKHRAMSKREEAAGTAEAELIAKAAEVWDSGDLDRCASLRQARLSRPDLIARLRR